MACDLPKGYRLGASLVAILCSFVLTISAFPNRGKGHGDSSHEHRQNCKDGNLWFKPNGECYPRGAQGPCGKNMIIAEHPKHERQGRCVCIKVVNCQYWPFAHFEEQNSCYPLYERGPCGESQWLVPLHQRRRNGPKEIWQKQEREEFIKGKCVSRECPPYNELYQMFSAYGECYQVGSQGFCERQEERLYFGKGSVYPQCSLNVIKAPNCNPTVGGGYGGPQTGGQGSGYGGQGQQSLVPEYGGQVTAPGYGGPPQPSLVPEYNGQAPGYGGPPPEVPEYNGQAPGYGGGSSPQIPDYSGAAPSYGILEAQSQPIQSPPVLEAVPEEYVRSATASPLPVLEPAPPSSSYLSESTVSPILIKTKVLGKAGALACSPGQVQLPTGACVAKATI